MERKLTQLALSNRNYRFEKKSEISQNFNIVRVFLKFQIKMKGIRDYRTDDSTNSPTKSKLVGSGIPEERVEVASPHYFEKLPILPGSCQFTDFGDECSTIFNFKCEGRAP